MWPGPECLVPAVTVAPMDRLPLLLMTGKKFHIVVYFTLHFPNNMSYASVRHMLYNV